MTKDISATRREAISGFAGITAAMSLTGCVDSLDTLSSVSGKSISYGETLESEISEGDGTDPKYDDLAEPVQFEGDADDTIAITMESSVMDTYLVLSNDGTMVAENDDGGTTTNSRLVVSLPEQATYTIWAGSFSGDATGEYTLSVEEVSDADTGADPRSITYGESVEGYVDRDDGTDPEFGDVAEPVTFDGQADDAVEITMRSDTIDCFLVLEGPNGSTVDTDDDGGGGTDSRIQTGLPSDGSYTIWAGSFGGDAVGSYTLSLDSVGNRSSQTDSRSISYGETLESRITAGVGYDPEFDDLAEPVEFEGSEGDSVEIVQRSSSIDCFLVLEDPAGNVVATNDDSGGETDSRIQTQLAQSGTYTVWAGSFSGTATGSYTLRLSQL